MAAGGLKAGATSCRTEWTRCGTAPDRVYVRQSGVSRTPGAWPVDHKILPIRTPELVTLSNTNCIVSYIATLDDACALKPNQPRPVSVKLTACV